MMQFIYKAILVMSLIILVIALPMCFAAYGHIKREYEDSQLKR